MDKCRSCYRSVYRLTNDNTGKPAPIDADPVADGNIAIDLEKGSYSVLAGPRLDAAREAGELLRKNHFATCPDSGYWKKKHQANAANVE